MLAVSRVPTYAQNIRSDKRTKTQELVIKLAVSRVPTYAQNIRSGSRFSTCRCDVF